jgi:hypothetical protein
MHRNILRGSFTLTIAISMLMSLPFPAPIASAGTIWHEGPIEFANGTMENVSLEGGAITLNINESLINNWTMLSSGYPVSRAGYAMVYEINHDKIVLFGGNEDYSLLNDTWTFDLNTHNWTNMNPSNAPSARQHFAMTYDSTDDELILFGGEDGNQILNDTWAYNITTNNWTNMNPSSAPAGRKYHAMAYNGKNGEVVLFGGYGAGDIYYNDTWTYSYSSNKWGDQKPLSAPLARGDHAMVCDNESGVIVLFGGENSSNNYFNDTLVYNLTSNIWLKMNPPVTPLGRCGHAMTYDSANDRILLFGGKEKNKAFGDTWTYDLRTDAWTNESPLISPPSRSDFDIVHDTAHNYSILFGGWDGQYSLNDAWTYDLNINNWSYLEPTIPLPRWIHAMVYDSTHKEEVLFGGVHGYYKCGYFNDTWTFNISTKKWTNMKPLTAPQNRAVPSMVYDNIHDKIILFGGWNDSYAFNDTWIYDLSTNNWTEMNPKIAPSIRADYTMAFDSSDGVVVLFGGQGNVLLLNDTWTYNLTTNNWTKMNPPTAPPSRRFHAMTYNSRSSEILLFGGLKQGSNGEIPLCDTWSYNYTTNSWTNMNPLKSPPSCFGSAMVYVSKHDNIFLSGGGSIDNPNTFWSYNYSTNYWTGISPIYAPPLRFGHTMAYHEEHDDVVLFGGTNGMNELGDTWIYRMNAHDNIGTYSSKLYHPNGTAYFGIMSWNASVPNSTSLRLQFRTADTIQNITICNFLGPDGTTYSYYETSGQQINSLNNGTCWFQYRVYFNTDDVAFTPMLQNVTINYNILQKASLLSPLGGENWTGLQNITWYTSDPDNDLLFFDISLIDSNGEIITLETNLTNQSWQWNTSNTPNGLYKIQFVARDDNPSIPLTVNITSGDFSIYHNNPPNHLPNVDLLSPPNNSIITNTSVHLSWRGIDLDGDLLTYMVRYSDNPLMQGAISSNSTTDVSMDIVNLSNNKSYYWTVDASDGKSNGTDIPIAIWSFSIKFNHPPKITSKPQLSVQVGDTYEYTVTAADVDNDTIVLSIIQAPNGISFNSSNGNIHWIPNNSDTGNHIIIVQASDGKGDIDKQIFTISVIPKPLPEKPKIVIIYPTNGSKIGGVVTIRGTAVNGSSALLLLQIRIDGGDWKNAVGLKNWSISIDMGNISNGKHKIEARAYDGNLYSDTASVSYSVYNPEPLISVEGGLGWIIIIIVLAGIGVSFVVIRQTQYRGPPKRE